MTKLVCTSCGEVHRAPFQPERGDLTCTCGGHRVLPSQAKPRKPLSRVSPSEQIGEPGNGPRRSSLRRGKGFSASTEQQRKVKGLPCIVCGRDEYEGVRIEAAHVYPRRLQACDCAEGVVPLCSGGVSIERAVVMFSGGAGSWGAAKRTVEDFDPSDVTLLFADTLIEDEDLYRYLPEAAENIGAELVRLEEGRDPWQVFFEGRFLGNTRIDPCSRVLKRELMREWLDENRDPKDTSVVLGFDWSEDHRFQRAKGYWEPWTVEAPLCERPQLSKRDVLDWLKEERIEPPRLYGMGFDHNNCGGFCIKAGQAQFEHLLRELPDRYLYHEQKEQDLREYLDKDISILRDRRGGELRPLTLRAFRERLEENPSLFDQDEWGGCSCMDDPTFEARR